MKTLIFLFLFISIGYAQEYNFGQRQDGYYVKDSTKWIITDTLNVGDEKCNHDWEEGEFSTAGAGRGCLVYHNGGHCSYDDKVKSRICKKCLRKEKLREEYYEHFQTNPETEFERLEKKINPPKQIEAVINPVTYKAIGTANLFPIWEGKPVTNILKMNKTWQQEFIDLWKEYKRECYADSTLDKYKTALTREVDTAKTNKYIRENPNEKFYGFFMKEEKIYSHKEAKLDNDFMEWLEKRLGDK